MKVIPAVMFIEMALDMLKAENPATTAMILKEFNCMGAARLGQLIELPSDGSTAQIAAGYLLGLQTARVLLSGKGIEL